MAISRAQMMKELLPGLNELFGLEYGSYENEHEDIYEMESSDRAFEEEDFILLAFSSSKTRAGCKKQCSSKPLLPVMLGLNLASLCKHNLMTSMALLYLLST